MRRSQMNNDEIEKIETVIIDNLKEIAKTKSFKADLDSQKIQDGDYILINNSFIFRKPFIKTNKNHQFVTLKVKNKEPDYANIYVSTPTDFDGDFKVIKSKQAASLKTYPLKQAIETEIRQLGQLVFFLIGEVIENSMSVDIPNSLVHGLKYDPISKGPELLELDKRRIIVVNQLTDPESVWNLVKSDLEKIPSINLPALETAFATSFEKLQNEVRLVMNLPKPTSIRFSKSFIVQLRNSVIEQRKLYKLALDKCVNGEDENDINLREVMRISYNFADDAIKLIQLLVSVSDLKAIILWLTIKSHIDLAESIRNLPWSKSEKKASPSNYVEKVKGARNHAFHNLLLFDKTIEADLSGVLVNAKKLTLLPPYAQRKTVVSFDYEDREIVEIISEITRATETVVTLDFWIKNSIVLEVFEKLLEATEDALWLLNSACNDK
jgi:hypothetical protein